MRLFRRAPVAQLDRAFASGAKGRWFESTRAYHPINPHHAPIVVLAGGAGRRFCIARRTAAHRRGPRRPGALSPCCPYMAI